MVEKAINYAKQFIGVKYTGWNPESGFPQKNCAPFWIDNKPPPPIELIKKNGLCCVGLTNLIRRYTGLQIPGLVDGELNFLNFIGGTENWFHYLKENNRLKKIDYKEKVPVGTLLLQNYNEIDQGHVAIIIDQDERGLFYSTKIHAIQHDIDDKYNTVIDHKYNNVIDHKYNKVLVEKFNDYFYYSRYTHICYPEDWILKN